CAHSSSRGLARRLTPNFAKSSSSDNWETWTRIGILFLMERREALEALSTRKLATVDRRAGSSPLTVLASRFCFCSELKRDSFGQSGHGDLLKTKAEAVEPVLDTDGGDPMVADCGVVNPLPQASRERCEPLRWPLHAVSARIVVRGQFIYSLN